ncbi:MAG: tyrosine-type recombinase/integrase [Deltaproteobacteria bacterium]|nr:tyrosine-type recombinase/integrase [Deltaproteobacteria bacterium]MBW2172593.1 tyrosine-type recombinase/integrase [Deltaproteobacteria bacterium]
MNLEHVSVENAEYHPEHLPPEPDKSTAFPPNETRSSPEIARILRVLSDKCLFGQDYVRQYLHDLYCRNCRPNTIRANGSAIILFLGFLKPTGRKHLETLTRDDVGGFIEHEQDRGLSPSSVSTRLRLLYAFFRFLMERDVIHPDVLKRKMHIKVPDALPRAIDPEDIRQLLAVIKNPRDRAMILALLRTGMRIGELLNTKLKDLNLEDKYIEIIEAQKNRVGRVVYLSDDACRALKKWLRLKNPQTECLFYGHSARPLSYAAARAVFKKYLDKAGLSHKGYTLHSLRHTCASELLNAGMHLECLQPLLGHHSIEMTRRYARLTDNTRREQYYKAMAVIERGDMNGYYRFDSQLP